MRTDQCEARQTDPATLREITRVATEIFTTAPLRHAAKAYLRQRGIDPDGLGVSWVLGYAPPGWTRLVDKLQGRFDDQALLDAGLAHRSSRGTLIDAFRDRVIFGIRGTDGRVAGFIARDLSGDPNAPKYLNTRQHALFDKSSLLFGLVEGDLHAHTIQPVVVEGPLDVLAIAARTKRNDRDLLPMAPCGTAFTVAHAEQVAEAAFAYHSPVVVAMDGDAAGRQGALAAGQQLRRVGVDVRIAELPAGSDPADYLARTSATLDAFRADDALPLLTVYAQHAIAVQGDRMQWIEGRLAALRTVAGYLATYPPAFAARQVAWLANIMDLESSTVTYEVAAAFQGRSLAATDRDTPARPALSI